MAIHGNAIHQSVLSTGNFENTSPITPIIRNAPNPTASALTLAFKIDCLVIDHQ
jgi:hypothetical protein